MNDDLTLLASTYLDGEATTDERAQVEADPDLLAEVERLRSVRAMMRSIDPPAISLRERQLAAALDVWDRLPDVERTGTLRDTTPTRSRRVAGIDGAAVAGAASVTAPTRLDDRRRGASTRWLTGAAAALVLVLAGGLALRLGNGSDDSSSSGASFDATASPAEVDGRDNETADATAGGRAESSTSAADDLVATADVDTSIETGIDNAAPPGESGGLAVLSNRDDLAVFAGAALGAPVSPDGAPAATSGPDLESPGPVESVLADAAIRECLGVDIIVGPAVYIDERVVVGIDEGSSIAIAYRSVDCSEVARVSLP